jgi:hypothetical protein
VLAGQYTAISVAETGTGMDAETHHVSSSIFTTKVQGKGTALGLYSEPGEGTTGKIYLPHLLSEAASEELPDALPIPEAAIGKTILVVEDPDVRAYSVESLKQLGHEVLDGPAAIIFLEGEHASTLSSRIVLPNEMTGRTS